MKGHTLDEFIGNVLLPGVNKMVDAGLGYLATGTIACGIEFLGACLDEYPFDKQGRSEKRFKVGITEFMGKVNPRYPPYNAPGSDFHLYKQLRCGMAHIIRPLGKVVFTGKGSPDEDGLHLTVRGVRPGGGKVLVLVVEDFRDDFAAACEMLRKRIPRLTNPKVKGVFLPVRELDLE